MIFTVFSFLAGLIIGSFLNVVIFRLKKGEQFLKGRSKCLACGASLGVWDLIPLFSFVFLQGRCRYCKAKISWQYPLVELATGLVFLIGFIHYYGGAVLRPPFLNYLAYLVFSCFLIIIFVYDARYYLILDKVSLSALVVAFVFNYFLGKPWQNLLLASVLVAGFFLLQFVLSKGLWIGGGDIRLGLVIGAMLGWPRAVTALIMSYVLGAIIGIFLVAFRQKAWKSQLPLGAFLAFASWAVYLWGGKIIDYWRLLGRYVS